MGIQRDNDGKRGLSMRLFICEMKRLLKTKMNLVIIVASLLLSLALAINLIAGSSVFDRGYDRLYEGKESFTHLRRLASPLTGEMTTDKFITANDHYLMIEDAYGGGEMDAVPEEIYQREIRPIRDFINIPGAILNDPTTSSTIPPRLRTSSELSGYYENRAAAVRKNIEEEYIPKDPQRVDAAMAVNEKVKTPFYYASTFGWDSSLENLGIMMTLLAFLLALITSSAFSSDYQTEADAILRTTRKGRSRLCFTKIAAALSLSIILYALCMAVMTAVFIASCGSEGLLASVQIDHSLSIAPMTYGELLRNCLISGLLGTIYFSAFSLFVSSRIPKPMVSLLISVVALILPTVLLLISAGNSASWLRLCLP